MAPLGDVVGDRLAERSGRLQADPATLRTRVRNLRSLPISLTENGKAARINGCGKLR